MHKKHVRILDQHSNRVKLIASDRPHLLTNQGRVKSGRNTEDSIEYAPTEYPGNSSQQQHPMVIQIPNCWLWATVEGD